MNILNIRLLSHFLYVWILEFGLRKHEWKLVISQLFCIFIDENQWVIKAQAMIIKDKITEFFCIVEEFNKNLDSEIQ